MTTTLAASSPLGVWPTQAGFDLAKTMWEGYPLTLQRTIFYEIGFRPPSTLPDLHKGVPKIPFVSVLDVPASTRDRVLERILKGTAYDKALWNPTGGYYVTPPVPAPAPARNWPTQDDIDFAKAEWGKYTLQAQVGLFVAIHVPSPIADPSTHLIPWSRVSNQPGGKFYDALVAILSGTPHAKPTPIVTPITPAPGSSWPSTADLDFAEARWTAAGAKERRDWLTTAKIRYTGMRVNATMLRLTWAWVTGAPGRVNPARNPRLHLERQREVDRLIVAVLEGTPHAKPAAPIVPIVPVGPAPVAPPPVVPGAALTAAEANVKAPERRAGVIKERQRLLASYYARKPVRLDLLEGPYGAYSTAPPADAVITITSPGAYDQAEFATIQGLTLHEIAHLLYTTPVGRAWPGISVFSEWHKYYNILEDARIEWIMVNRWRVKDHFIRLMKVMEMKHPLLMWGRRHYLPYNVPAPEPARVPDLIDEYMGALDIQVRVELAEELAKIYHEDPPVLPPSPFSEEKAEGGNPSIDRDVPREDTRTPEQKADEKKAAADHKEKSKKDKVERAKAKPKDKKKKDEKKKDEKKKDEEPDKKPKGEKKPKDDKGEENDEKKPKDDKKDEKEKEEKEKEKEKKPPKGGPPPPPPKPERIPAEDLEDLLPKLFEGAVILETGETIGGIVKGILKDMGKGGKL